jgi:hypothetical protein
MAIAKFAKSRINQNLVFVISLLNIMLACGKIKGAGSQGGLPPYFLLATPNF